MKTAALLSILFIPSILQSQVAVHIGIGTVQGEPIIHIANLRDNNEEGTIRTIATARSLYVQTGIFYAKQIYIPPPGNDIEIVRRKTNDPSKLLILLSGGGVLIYDAIANTTTQVNQADFFTSASVWDNVGGDALYKMSYTEFHVLRDTATTWQTDTSGLGAVNFNAFVVDSLQYVYLATTGGVFKQHPDSSVWHKLSAFPETYANALFADARNRIYAATYSSVYFSTNGGSSWTSNGTGLAAGGVTAFGEDAFHNIYAIGGGQVFRSDSGTSAWVRIDTSVTNKIKDPVSQFSNPFNDVGGDSVLFLATNYGLFSSTDQGRTWAESDSGISATTLYGYLKTPTRQFVSTALGLFRGSNADTVWTKVYPSNGYEVGNSIYADNNSNVYTLGPIINSNNSQSPNSNWKSTDNGSTWVADTAGLNVMKAGSIPKYFADESGVQHYAVFGIPVECYQKSAGSAWSPDTSGWGNLPGNYPNVIASDAHGSIYAALTTTTDYTGLLLKRAIGGGTWGLDTAGLQKAIVYSISANQGGNLYAGTYGNGVYKKTGATWAPLSSPGGLSGNDAFVTAVNKSGVLFTGFAYQNGFNYAWQGVYCTTNDGGSWTKLGLDGISVRALIPSGDSVYAVTYNDGLYVLTSTPTNGVAREKVSTPNSFTLSQNYPNPFNPTTSIEFTVPSDGRASLKVFDILGREVATLVDGEVKAGVLQQATFDASKMSSGIYFARLQFGGKQLMKKMVLMK